MVGNGKVVSKITSSQGVKKPVPVGAPSSRMVENNPTERIELRKVYAGSAALLGLLYGLILGIIDAIIVIISGFVVPGGIIVGVYQFNTLGWIFGLAGIVLVANVVLMFLVVLLGSLIYNLVSRMGGGLHLGLAEHVPEVKKPKKPMPSKLPVKSSNSSIAAAVSGTSKPSVKLGSQPTALTASPKVMRSSVGSANPLRSSSLLIKKPALTPKVKAKKPKRVGLPSVKLKRKSRSKSKKTTRKSTKRTAKRNRSRKKR